jgi:outer membrane protein OmpA-like peptidoglycan-associated protein
MVRILYIFIICLFAYQNTYANEKNNVNINKLIYEAEDALYNENYRKSIELFTKLDSIDPLNRAYYAYKIGISYLYSNLDNSLSIPYLEEALIELSESEMGDLAHYHMGRAYHLNYQFDLAIEQYNKTLEILKEFNNKTLISETERQIIICNNAKKAYEEKQDLEVVSVGNAVNSEYPDYKPVITTDESIMYFTSRKPGSTGDEEDITGRYYEDIYVSERDPFGHWDYPVHASNKINSDLDEATIGLSPDGSKMYIYKGDKKGGAIYTASLSNNDWTEPVDIGKGINTKYWETSATISADGKTIYFVSTRKRGYGNRDLYTSKLNDDGTWSVPENLGGVINTPYDEDTPFIHPDGKTLYFSSNGHNTMGGFDIFSTTFENGAWTTPKNLGYPINSTADDFHFVTNYSGKRGYFSSSRNGGRGEQDIYFVNLDPNATVPLLVVRGDIFTLDGSPIPKTTITLVNKETNEVLNTVLQPDPTTGEYIIIVPPEGKYEMIVEADGYKKQTLDIKFPNPKEFYEMYQQIVLEGVDKDISVNNYLGDLRRSSDSTIADASSKINKDYILTIAENLKSKSIIANASSFDELKEKHQDLFDKLLEMTDPVADLLKYSLDEEENVLAEGIDSDNNKDLEVITEKDDDKNKDDSDPSDVLSTLVYFGFDKHNVEEQYIADIEKVLNTFKRKQNVKIEIVGHTDSKGPDSYNIVLSKKRADAVAKVLVEKGVAKDSITVTYKGESQPMAPNANPDGTDNPDGRKLNRRTEVKIVSQ